MICRGKRIGDSHSIPREARLKILGEQKTAPGGCSGGENNGVPEAEVVARG